MVKTKKKLRKTLDVRLCYHLCKKGVHTNRYKVRGIVFDIPLPLLEKVEEIADRSCC